MNGIHPESFDHAGDCSEQQVRSGWQTSDLVNVGRLYVIGCDVAGAVQ